VNQSAEKRGGFLPKFLGFIVMLFIGILIGTYLIARQADPVILDEHGNVRSGGGQSAPRR
jgi:F0F1-type ATP synthase assembly protein I